MAKIFKWHRDKASPSPFLYWFAYSKPSCTEDTFKCQCNFLEIQWKEGLIYTVAVKTGRCAMTRGGNIGQEICTCIRTLVWLLRNGLSTTRRCVRGCVLIIASKKWEMVMRAFRSRSVTLHLLSYISERMRQSKKRIRPRPVLQGFASPITAFVYYMST